MSPHALPSILIARSFASFNIIDDLPRGSRQQHGLYPFIWRLFLYLSFYHHCIYLSTLSFISANSELLYVSLYLFLVFWYYRSKTTMPAEIARSGFTVKHQYLTKNCQENSWVRTRNELLLL